MSAKHAFNEDVISQIPALQLLINLGFQYLTPEEVYRLRGARLSNVVLDGIVTPQLAQMNRFRYKGQEYPFTEGNILSAVQALKDVMYDGLIRTNEKIYDLVSLGKSLQQSIDGDLRSSTLKYIDWDNPENNVYHCTAEFEVERSGSHETRRPDIICFVNGIPLVVIECKSPVHKEPVDEAISQHIRNQKEGEIPGLFVYSQLLLSLAVDHAKYATTGTAAKFWAEWKENLSKDEQRRLERLVNRQVPDDVQRKLFDDPFREAQNYIKASMAGGPRLVTAQDRIVFALCRPERLLHLTYRYLLFDAGEKKIARYQQYFCVEKTMDRVKQFTAEGSRKGGVVWHTQGSGKSLTMVMLAKALSLEPSIRSPRIVLVTDRVDLDDQIYNTFRHTGKDPVQAKTGRHLLDLLAYNKEQIITTVIDKFEAAVGSPDSKIDDPNIFVLVDEGHRTQYGPRHAKMRNVLPRACYLGFTGTPVAKKDRNTVDKFGGLIDTYTITQATEDKAVVRLLYEGRHVPQKVDAESLDNWFEKITHNLTKEQIADLKRKFATADQLNKAEQKVKAIAWDISMHWSQNWSGTGFKGQLVAPDKATALLYKKYLDEFGLVSSEVLISGPSEPEGDEDIYTENTKEVMTFWKGMMQRFGTDKEYNRQLISAFKSSESPEIIIVVDKLLTGFDAPRNTVLYLTRSLKDHTLLQAIARVNRLHDGKEFGYIIDYRGVLENLDEALLLYSSLAEFDAQDLADIWQDVSAEITKLPQRHSDLWDIFKGVKNRRDVEEYERLLADDALRAKFYERFRDYSGTLAIAMASERFLEETPVPDQERYRQDLKFFGNLRVAVQRRYAERISYTEYEPKIKKLIDTHVGTGQVEQITPLVDIFDQEAFAKEVEKVTEPSGKADTIAHRLQKTISERWQEDPAFYEKFSKMLEEVIRAFREQRIAATQYLKQVTEIMTSVVNRVDEEIPSVLNGHNEAKAFYGVVNGVAESLGAGGDATRQASAEIALRIDEILESRRIVNWVHNPDQQNAMRTEMEDYLFDAKERLGVPLGFDDIDRIMEECIEVFKVRRP